MSCGSWSAVSDDAAAAGLCLMKLSLLQCSIITGILFVTFVSWIPGHAASYLGSSAESYPGKLAAAIMWPFVKTAAIWHMARHT